MMESHSLKSLEKINIKEWDSEEEVYTSIDLGKFLSTQINAGWETREPSTLPSLHPNMLELWLGRI